jgi:zinc D-Ala-D-Ala carboxypeptidase
MGDLSAHFSRSEFACPCCGIAKVDAALVAVLERIRAAHYPEGLRIVSGYRCPTHNAAVGGAAASQHLRARAADIVPRITPAQARACGARGIGIAHTGEVVHVDVGPTRAPWHYDEHGKAIS